VGGNGSPIQYGTYQLKYFYLQFLYYSFLLIFQRLLKTSSGGVSVHYTAALHIPQSVP